MFFREIELFSSLTSDILFWIVKTFGGMCVDFELVHIFVSRLTTDTFGGRTTNNSIYLDFRRLRKQRLEKSEKSH